MSQKGWRCDGCMIIFDLEELHVFHDPEMDELRHLFVHTDCDGGRYYENCGPVSIYLELAT